MEPANDMLAMNDQTSSYTIPSQTAAWFNMDSIEDIEKYSLPEFFRGVYPSKTPTTYKEYRNFMINLYRMNPMTYVTATSKCSAIILTRYSFAACRRHLSGDACAIVRIHAFLEKWGLINFNVQPDLKPHKMSLLKENTYSKVLINATNREHLTKNENEYIGNLFDTEDASVVSTNVDQSSPVLEKRPKQPGAISAASLRKINLLTAKERPFCSFCNNLVGYHWYVERSQPAEAENKMQAGDEDPEKLQVAGQ